MADPAGHLWIFLLGATAIFIQTEPTANPARMRFLPGRAVLSSGTADFLDAESSAHSPLAQRLFEIEGVTGVFLDPESVTLSKSDDKDWQILKPVILVAIVDHFTAGEPVILDQTGNEAEGDELFEDEDADPEITAKIKELIDTRIKPAATQDGGDVNYRGFKDGVVFLEMTGPASGLMARIETMLRHYVPEVEGVADYRDAAPKPGLDTEEGKAIRHLLDERINPQVANHGGHIALVDVKDDTVYIRLEGGCQGCGMADVTLKQGVATEIQALVPTINRVLDVTDHAGGTNPYYQPGKGGASAI
jgi:Fe-S cluster biogenesis protein NfuA